MAHFLYAVSADRRFIKFGVTRRLSKRILNLQTSTPMELRLLASMSLELASEAFQLEGLVHAALDDYRVRGEWFKSCPKTLGTVELMRKYPRFDRFRSILIGWLKNDIHNGSRNLGMFTVANAVYGPPKRLN